MPRRVEYKGMGKHRRYKVAFGGIKKVEKMSLYTVDVFAMKDFDTR